MTVLTEQFDAFGDEATYYFPLASSECTGSPAGTGFIGGPRMMSPYGALGSWSGSILKGALSVSMHQSQRR